MKTRMRAPAQALVDVDLISGDVSDDSAEDIAQASTPAAGIPKLHLGGNLVHTMDWAPRQRGVDDSGAYTNQQMLGQSWRVYMQLLEARDLVVEEEGTSIFCCASILHVGGKPNPCMYCLR